MKNYKVSTYLPPPSPAVKGCEAKYPESGRRCSLVSFPTRTHCGFVPFHNKNLPGAPQFHWIRSIETESSK